MPRPAPTALLASALLLATAARAGADDAAMRELAARSGCTACHHVDPGRLGPDGLPPLGPAWRDVSVKYTGQRGAEDMLVATVVGGSRPGLSHWKASAGGPAMPPNRVEISAEDARRLVRWILALGPGD